MTFSSMQTRVGELINQAVSNDNLTVTNTEVKAWLNLGYKMAINSVVTLNENFLLRLTKANLVANQEYYALPSDCRKIVRVEIGYESSSDRERAVRIDVNSIDDPDNTFSQGTPVYYVTGNQIRILPAPTANVTAGLWLEYIESPADMSNASDTPSLPEGYDYLPIMYAVAKAKYKLGLKDEADAGMDEFRFEIERMKDEVLERNLDGHDSVIMREIY